MNNNKKITTTLLTLFLGILFTSCISNVEEQLIDDSVVVEEMNVSYNDNVKPIIEARCTICHSQNGTQQQPYLDGFSNVKVQAERVKVRVDNRTMPQGSTLTNAQIQIIVDWVNEGALDN